MTVIDERVSPATRTAIERDVFGHVIDGERVAAEQRRDAGHRRSVDRRRHRQGRGRQRSTTWTGPRVRHVPRSRTVAGATCRRWRRRRSCATWPRSSPSAVSCSARSTCSTPGCCAPTPGSSSSSPSTASSTSAAGRRSCRASIPPVPSEFNVSQVREPIGVVGLIMPWNGPTAVFAMVAAALAAGNSVVLKPAEQTPMAAVLMAEVALDAGLPPGVFNVVQGTGRDVGQALVEHPEVDAISFTGSVATGSAIQAAAAKGVKRVALELGGKSPFIVFPDADLDAAAATSMAAVWGASGQVCTCGTRVLVHESIYDDWVNRVVDGSKNIKIGPGMDPTSEMGPVVSASPTRAGQEVRRHRPGGRRRAGARRPPGRRQGLLPRADDLHRRAQRHAHRPGGDLRAGDGHPAVLDRGGGIPHRQRRQLRPRRRRVDQRPRPRPAGLAGAQGRHGVDQHLPDGLPERAVRRREAVRPRPHARRRRRSRR